MLDYRKMSQFVSDVDNASKTELKHALGWAHDTKGDMALPRSERKLWEGIYQLLREASK